MSLLLINLFTFCKFVYFSSLEHVFFYRDRERAPKIPQFSTLASGGAVYPTGKEPADENTPTYWSASELLEKHEQVSWEENIILK